MFVLSYQIAPQFATPDGASEDKLRAIVGSFRLVKVIDARPSGSLPSAERQRIALADHDVSAALWRPGRDEIVVFVTPGTKTASPGPRIERWSLGGAKRVVREIGAPPAIVRADGSAAITTGGMLVDLESGDATPIPGARIDLWPRVAVAF